MEAAYFAYNDIYKSFFSYEQVAGVRIVITNGENLTFLPTMSSGLWMAMGECFNEKNSLPQILIIYLYSGLLKLKQEIILMQSLNL